MTERLGNIGYFAMVKESAVGTVGTPTIYVPLYDENVDTLGNFVDLSPAAGHRFATHLTVPGTRSHKGEVTILGEPNTTGHIINGMMTKGSTTGSDPYTHPFTIAANGTVPTYTVDISLGNVVKRVWGVGFSKLAPNWNENEMQLKASLSGLGSFMGREIASVSGAGPYTVVLKDPDGIYDGNPSKGLVASDLIRFYDVSAGTSIDATVATVAGVTSFTTSTNPSGITAGDIVTLRPATPSHNNLAPFLWTKTKFFFAADASTAAGLAVTAHLPVDPGSTWEIMHNFNKDDGEPRSGSHDPASLPRALADAKLNVKKIFDTPEDVQRFNAMEKRACVVRHYVGSTNQYYLQLTFNHLKTDKPAGMLKSGELTYAEVDYHVQNDSSDGQAWGATVLNALSSM